MASGITAPAPPRSKPPAGAALQATSAAFSSVATSSSPRRPRCSREEIWQSQTPTMFGVGGCDGNGNDDDDDMANGTND